MGLRHSRTTLVRIAALSLWAVSASLLIHCTAIAPEAGVEALAWALWIQMCAWAFTAWWLMDSLHTRDRVRVSDLAEIMARVAVEEQQPQHRARLTRIH